jgi:chorismate lyase / 3-hydroxybenzoate synthase
MNRTLSPIRTPSACRPHVTYVSATSATELLAAPGTLALLEFGRATADTRDPRALAVGLEPVRPGGMDVCEHWHVDDEVVHGRDGDVQWACGGGWLFTALTVDERDHGGPEAAAEHAYSLLCGFLASRPQRHVQRLWNYLGDINAGEGDHERYKHFCAGRLRGMGDFFADGFPAATAIGHRLDTPLLQVYCLAAEHPGARVENPRQMSAWRYPRQYGPTPPSFARAMRLHGGDSLAISGTASITGHESRHPDDLAAQLTETLANLRALLREGGLPEHFTADDPLKVYVRHAEHAEAVDAFLAEHVPHAPRLLLLGDVCRRELLVEIDGWRYAH